MFKNVGQLPNRLDFERNPKQRVWQVETWERSPSIRQRRFGRELRPLPTAGRTLSRPHPHFRPRTNELSENNSKNNLKSLFLSFWGISKLEDVILDCVKVLWLMSKVQYKKETFISKLVLCYFRCKTMGREKRD